jgi:hypothetical protein
MSVIFLLAVAAFIVTIVAALGKCPLWIAVLLLNIIALLQVLPLK